jgi:hypothetical protein
MDVMSGSLGVLLGLLAIAGALIVVAGQLGGLRADIRRMLEPSVDDRLGRVADQTAANRKLVETREGRQIFVDYVMSEAAVWQFISDVESRLRGPNIDIEERAREIVEDKRSITDRIKDFYREHKPKFIEMMVGKINDLVGQFIPGGKGEAKKK